MNRKAIICSFIVFTAVVCPAIPFDRNDSDYTQSLNNEWKFRLAEDTQTELLSEFFKTDFDDADWAAIVVPSNWEMLGFEEPHYYRPDPSRLGLYRKQIQLPPSWKNHQVIVHFEGISFGYTLYVNGQKIGSFQHAFLPCQFDLTPYIRYDEPNIIAVKVYRNHDERHFDCNDAWALSGIYRDAFLFSPERYHIDQFSIDTKLDIPKQAAVIEGYTDIRIFRHNLNSQYLDQREVLKPLALKLVLKDADGNVMADQIEAVSWLNPRVVPSHAFKILITHARYWNAERPYLYDLSMILLVDGQVSHTVNQKVGLREVTIEDGILKLNGQRIKLRGVCRHEIHPAVGRALREKHWLEDIKLMKVANINAVRCSHYPPHSRFLELCDEYGLYVLDEVPIGFGEDHQNDPIMLGAMLSRAELTVARDRNHPSVIVWDIGNENPLYSLQETAARHVKMMDPTRPLLYPGENFVGRNKSFATGSADFIDIIAPHYPHNEEIESDKEDAAIRKPIIYTEINHALDTAFSDFATKWQMIENTDKMAGAMIWLWADQGIIRKVNGRPVIDSYADISTIRGRHTALSGDVWLDDNTILDSHGPDGTDGIVYADRRPQTDYYQTRKLYSPIKIPQEYIKLDADGRIRLEVKNQYDFTNLNRHTANWKFLINGKPFKEGRLSLDCPPHESQTVEIEIGLLKIALSDLMLQIYFFDENQNPVYERSLMFENSRVDWLAKMDKEAKGSQSDGTGIKVNDNGLLTIKDPEEITLLRGPFVRVGRKPTMAERKTYERMDLTIWEPSILTGFEVLNRTEIKQDDLTIIEVESQYTNPQNTEQSVKADLTYKINPAGWVDVEYTLTPDSKDGALLELGLGWQIQNAEKITWLGDGPYPAYPYKHELAERGIYTVTREHPFFDGNRMNVELLKILLPDGQIGIITEPSNIGWEKASDTNKIIVYQNQKVASLGTKFKLPRQVIKAQDIGSVKGSMRFVVLSDAQPEFIQTILGNPEK